VVTEKRLEGPPDLIVEVLSPGTERRDKKDKFELYQRFGVREYWIMHPQEEYIEVWRLENGVLVRQGVYGPDESFVSAVLGGKTVELKGIFVSEK
jgi:Uma2 family endonuclease